MKKIITLNAFSRDFTGTSKCRRLRKLGKIPGVIYGLKKSKYIILNKDIQIFILKNIIFRSSLIILNIDNTKIFAILKKIYFHPFHSYVLHLDFHVVEKKKKINTKIKLKFSNDNSNILINNNKINILYLIKEIEIECFFKYLPEFIEIDLLKIKINKKFYAKDIVLPYGVKLTKRFLSRNPIIFSTKYINNEDKEEKKI